MSYSLVVNIKPPGSDSYRRYMIGSKDIVSVEFVNSMFTTSSGTVDFIDHNYTVVNELQLNSGIDGKLILHGSSRLSMQDADYMPNDTSEVPVRIVDWRRVSSGADHGVIRVSIELGSYYDNIARTSVYRNMDSVAAISAEYAARHCRYATYSDFLISRGYSKVPRITTKDTPPKIGGWYGFMEGMTDTIDYIKDHSLIDNDYLFTCYDELRSKYMISSVVERFTHDVSNYVIFNGKAPTNIQNSVASIGKNVVFTASDIVYANDTSHYYESIYPNVAYLFGDASEVNVSNIDFASLRRNVDGSPAKFDPDDIKSFLKTTPKNITPAYGPRRVKRLSNNNTHPLHSFAEDYRRAYIATFAKKIDIRLDGTYGPPIGSVNTVLLNELDGVNTKLQPYDAYNSGRYLLYSKHHKYDAVNSGGINSVTCHYMSNGAGINEKDLQNYPREIVALLRGGSI